ncbi:hypothetical protein ACFY71_14280 [Streptomyces cinerochromogenes]|uniref:hypothetical protein n=1 Tax=Streptomyces cinerochromogenes TaxID=66422 RepID=UPI0036B2029D
MNRLDWMDRMDRMDRLDRMRRLRRVDRAREPIYAGLVAEWRAQGRTVPAEPEALWAALLGLTLDARRESEHL